MFSIWHIYMKNKVVIEEVRRTWFVTYLINIVGWLFLGDFFPVFKHLPLNKSEKKQMQLQLSSCVPWQLG